MNHALGSLALLQFPSDASELFTPLVVVGLVAFLVVASLVMFFVSRYKRCPPNQVMVVYGSGGAKASGDGRSVAKIVNGGGTMVWPVIQDYAFLSLLPHQIDIPLTDALSAENIRIRVPSSVTVAIGDTAAMQANAAIRLLGESDERVEALAADIIFGVMRQVIAGMEIEKINRDRDHFTSAIQDALAPELEKLGLKLINVNIRDISDEGGFIEAIGRKAAAEAVQTANADVAEEVRKGETRVAKANQAKDIEVAAANRDREIGVQEAEKDQAVKIADLQRETQVAQERAQFLRDTQVAEADQTRRVAVAKANATAEQGEADADQSRRIAVAAANATAVEGETQAKAKIADANAELAVREAEAYRKGETQKRISQAAVEEAEAEAQAKAALAEAKQIEAEQRARLEAPAKAEKAKRIVEAEAAAERERIEAEGRAKAIFAEAEAQARGELERLRAQAEGLEAIVEACGGADEAYRLLMIEHVPHLAETAAEAIKSIKFDKVVLWGGAGGKGAGAGVSSFVADLMGALPPALHTMLDIGGVKVGDGKRFGIVPDGEAAQGDGAEIPALVTHPAGAATTGAGNAAPAREPTEENPLPAVEPEA